MAYIGHLYPAIWQAYVSRLNENRVFRTQEEAMRFDISEANQTINEYLVDGGVEGLHYAPEPDTPFYKALQVLLDAGKYLADKKEEDRLLAEAELDDYERMKKEAPAPISDEIPF